MSKAFTRESDDAPDLPLPRPAAVLPPGAKNLMTPGGAARLRAELERLAREERPALAKSASAEDGAKNQLRALDQRMEVLHQKLQTAVVTGPPVPGDDVVRFGATVVVRERSGEQTTYRIVGMDETDLDQNWVSWLSPIAKALLNGRAGQRVRFKVPAGEEELEILSVAYE
ncbi:MAG TPA: GreA/GreB family elongation factor [Verrucomicrobiae bacterium]|jgi:transcription elongation factor GreB